uniref:Cupin type-1 domain-containing protein n=1 Tax=Leersia perrieri TaxID=77586 RepID=A0A0D9VF07_9ORYZ
MAQLFDPNTNPWHNPRQGAFRECRFDRLQAFESLHRVTSEAGVTEHFDEKNEQFQCIGIFVVRRVIEPQGLLVPRYTNTPGMVYIIQGLYTNHTSKDFVNVYINYGSTCFQVKARAKNLGMNTKRFTSFRQGDIVALPSGVAHWFYNDGDTPIVAIYVFDINNNANQLEPRHKNAILSPFWNVNAHSLVYMIQGRAQVQVVSNLGKTVFNGVLHQGQLLVIPQHYVVLKKAEREGCQYIAFKTNAKSIVSHLAGRNSILRAMPVDVVTNAYHALRTTGETNSVPSLQDFNNRHTLDSQMSLKTRL